jgi:hypothetical protein
MDFGADFFVSFIIITFSRKVPCRSVTYLCVANYHIREETNLYFVTTYLWLYSPLLGLGQIFQFLVLSHSR